MSEMRATGMTAFAGFAGSGISGAGTPMRGMPTPLAEPCPKAKPPPGSPTPPSIEASAIDAQNGCSP